MISKGTIGLDVPIPTFPSASILTRLPVVVFSKAKAPAVTPIIPSLESLSFILTCASASVLSNNATTLSVPAFTLSFREGLVVPIPTFVSITTAPAESLSPIRKLAPLPYMSHLPVPLLA